MRKSFAVLAILLSGSVFAADRFEAGFSKLWIEGQNPGNQAWYTLHHVESRAWEFEARTDYLQKFGFNEGRISPAVTYHWGGIHALTMELGLAPSAQIFPSFTAGLEYSRPVFSGAAVSGGVRFQNYAQTQVLGASVGGEYYLKNGLAFVGRTALNQERYLDNTTALQPAATLRTVYYFTDDDRAWIYGGLGSEGFMAGVSTPTGSAPGSIATRTWGAGFRKGIKDWGLETNLDWQNREGTIGKLVTLSTALQYRF